MILSIHTLKDGKTESGSSCLLASFTNLILASILFCNSILSFFLSAAFVLLFDLVILIKVLFTSIKVTTCLTVFFASLTFLVLLEVPPPCHVCNKMRSTSLLVKWKVFHLILLCNRCFCTLALCLASSNLFYNQDTQKTMILRLASSNLFFNHTIPRKYTINKKPNLLLSVNDSELLCSFDAVDLSDEFAELRLVFSAVVGM